MLTTGVTDPLRASSWKLGQFILQDALRQGAFVEWLSLHSMSLRLPRVMGIPLQWGAKHDNQLCHSEPQAKSLNYDGSYFLTNDREH